MYVYFHLHWKDVLLQSVYEYKFSHDDCCPLEKDRLPTVISKILDPEHPRIREAGSLREDPFEIRKEWRVIESPC